MRIRLKSISSGMAVKNPNMPFLIKRLGNDLAAEIQMLTVPKKYVQSYTGLDTPTATEIYYIFMHPNFDLVRDFKLAHLKPLAEALVQFTNSSSESAKKTVRQKLHTYLDSLDSEFMNSKEVRSLITDLRRQDFAEDASIMFREHNDFHMFTMRFPEGNLLVVDHTQRIGSDVLKQKNTLWSVQVEGANTQRSEDGSLVKNPILALHQQKLEQYLKDRNIFIRL